MTDKQEEISKKKEEKKPNIFSKIKRKLLQYRRVLDVSRKPDRSEFISSVKITGSGIVLIGLIGFIIFLLYFLIRAVWSGMVI